MTQFYYSQYILHARLSARAKNLDKGKGTQGKLHGGKKGSVTDFGKGKGMDNFKKENETPKKRERSRNQRVDR